MLAKVKRMRYSCLCNQEVLRMRMRLIDPDNVKEEIALKGFSQNGFSRQINVTSSYLSKVLNQEVCPSPVVAKKISDGINVKISDIFFAVDGLKSDTSNCKEAIE